jgi:hypothetical protein
MGEIKAFFSIILVFSLILTGCMQKEISNNSPNIDSEKTTLKGKIILNDLIRCTKMACSKENPCCNKCSTSPILETADTKY